ncbi:type III PLP-dependent enzyme [Vibrio cionasavignyae]|uniref:type III PLP-dependent enzyme n=1 Tax=Vibrio cionasavignyae TaxID=2910252 RepID=UPI003D113D93
MSMINVVNLHELQKGHQDSILFDLNGMRNQYNILANALPDLDIRFAIKSCAIPSVLETLASCGAGFDAASVTEIEMALAAGGDINRIHFGNTIKSNSQIRTAYDLGIRDFASDSIDDIRAIAFNAPESRVFCRIATDGKGAVYGLSRKFGSSDSSAIRNLIEAKRLGLVPAGISVHVGSQQMTESAWINIFKKINKILIKLQRSGIELEYINLGGGLPADGYSDKSGKRLKPPRDKIFSAIQAGMQDMRDSLGYPIKFIMEPGRYIVADHGIIRASVLRLSERVQPDGTIQKWLFLSCGRFNGLYETDALRYKMVFPRSQSDEFCKAVIAGPTCDSDDVFNDEDNVIPVPKDLRSGDPVWILSCGAYSTSYMTTGFNGFAPLPHVFIGNKTSENCIDIGTRKKVS